MNPTFAPPTTPAPLKILLLSTLILSIFSPLLIPYLALSPATLTNLSLWQLITYLFIHPFPQGLIHLAFNLYLIWVFGASLIERIHSPLFFSLYFGSGICGGLSAILGMHLFHTSMVFLGSSAALYSLLIAWVFLNPEARLLLFFAVPFKARNLLLFLIGINLLIDLSSANWIPLFAYVGSLIFGYFFTILSCRIRSPFHFLAPLENTLLKTLEKVEHLGKKAYRHTKIYDIQSGKPVLSDDQFMDAMLAKISLYGEEVLSLEEKMRMKKISEKKSRR